MSCLAAPLRFCLLLLPLLCLSAGFEPARAEDKLAISFELPPAKASSQSPQSQPSQSLVRYRDRLPPIETRTATQTAENKTSTEENIALQFAKSNIALPVAGKPQEETVSTIPETFTINGATEKLLATSHEASSRSIGSSLIGSSGVVRSLQQRLDQTVGNGSEISGTNILEADILEDWIYEGGSNSLVARTVGSAEGTRKSNGERTKAYYGHVDPGNGVWNLGTFSYQHEASSPEEADEKQLKRLQSQERQLKEKALYWNVPMSIEVRLNGLDLANQAPLAALDKGGYIERLAEAYTNGKSGEAAIVWARTHAYFDPDKQAWDAPGLGNNRYSIQQDQARRMAAIDSALRRYKDEHVGRIESLSEVYIASAGTTMDGALLAQTRSLTDSLVTDSLDSVDFSLDPAPSTASNYTISDYETSGYKTLDYKTLDYATLSDTSEVAIDPLETLSKAPSKAAPTSVAEDVDAVEADISEAERLEAYKLDNREIAFEDSLAFEADLINLSELDAHYASVADETVDLVDTESTPLEDGLVFEDTESLNLPIADDDLTVPSASLSADTDIKKADLQLEPAVSVIKRQEERQEEQKETATLLETIPSGSASEDDVQTDSVKPTLDRLLEGIKPSDRPLSVLLDSQITSQASSQTASEVPSEGLLPGR